MLGLLVQNKQMMEHHLLPVCTMLKMLYNANNNEKIPIIPNHTFYSNNLSGKLDVKQEYDQWQILLHPTKER